MIGKDLATEYIAKDAMELYQWFTKGEKYLHGLDQEFGHVVENPDPKLIEEIIAESVSEYAYGQGDVELARDTESFMPHYANIIAMTYRVSVAVYAYKDVLIEKDERQIAAMEKLAVRIDYMAKRLEFMNDNFF